MSDSPGKRLASFRKSLALSQRDFGSSLAVSGGLVGQIEADIAPPSRAFLQKISDRYRVSSDWLLSGHGEMLRPPGQEFIGRTARIDEPNHAKPMHGDFSSADSEFALVKRMEISVSAGNGLEACDGAERSGAAFPVRWLKKIGVAPDFAVMVTVSGDSMAPAIPDGSLVLIDAMSKTVDAPGIYAFSLDGESFVKRLIPTTEHDRLVSLTILSDNHAYLPKVLTSSQAAKGLRIAGRVRAVLAEV